VNDNLPAGCVAPNCNRDKWSVQSSSFAVGVQPFGDRNYIIETTAPDDPFRNNSWIRTAADSKAFTGDPLATFTARGVEVILMVDTRHNNSTGRPTFLTDPAWTDATREFVIRQSSTVTARYHAWKKIVIPGSMVTLPRVNSPFAPTYFVILN